jgi:hypothetical protein
MTLFKIKKPSKVNLLYEFTSVEESCRDLFKISQCFPGWTEANHESCIIMISLHAKIWTQTFPDFQFVSVLRRLREKCGRE